MQHKTSTLREIAVIKMGYQAKFSIEPNPEGTHHLIQGRDFDNTLNLKDNLVKFFPEIDPKHYLINKGDILFHARGANHFAHCIENDMPNTLAAASFYILRLIMADIHPAFIAWLLNQRPYQIKIHSMSRGTGISLVSIASLYELEIQIPPKEIQGKVCSVINLWKQEKSLHQKLIDRRSLLIETACMNTIQK